MNQSQQWISAMIIGLFMSLFSAFVAMNYWNWFVVDVLNISEITFIQMLWIIWFIGIFSHNQNSNDYKWKTLFSIIEYCIPRENIETVKEVIQEQSRNVRQDAFVWAFWQFIGLSISLLIWFLLYSLS